MPCTPFVKRFLAFGGSNEACATMPQQIALGMEITRGSLEEIGAKIPRGAKYAVAYTQLFVSIGGEDNHHELPVGQPFDSTGRLYFEGWLTTLGKSELPAKDKRRFGHLSLIDTMPKDTPVLIFGDGDYEFIGEHFQPKMLAA